MADKNDTQCSMGEDIMETMTTMETGIRMGWGGVVEVVVMAEKDRKDTRSRKAG